MLNVVKVALIGINRFEKLQNLPRSDQTAGHVRAPAYLRGKTGVIERALGAFRNPEKLAYGLPAEEQAIVAMAQRAERDVETRPRRCPRR